jgi:hypothetical protein
VTKEKYQFVKIREAVENLSNKSSNKRRRKSTIVFQKSSKRTTIHISEHNPIQQTILNLNQHLIFFDSEL